MRRFALIALVVLTSIPAWAGQKRRDPVTVLNGGRLAYGSVGTARNSADGNQSIGCTFYVWNGTDSAVQCTATDAAGNSGSCTLYYPSQLWRDAVSTINGDSYIAFYWDASWNCTQIEIRNRSEYEPKQP